MACQMLMRSRVWLIILEVKEKEIGGEWELVVCGMKLWDDQGTELPGSEIE